MLGKPNEIEYQDKKRMGKEERLKYLFLYSSFTMIVKYQ